MSTFFFLLLVGLLCVASFFSLFTIYAAWRVSRVRPRRVEALPPVSLFKPLKGAPADLYDSLASFCRIDYPTFQILCGVHDADDPAIAIVHRLQRDFPERDIVLVVDSVTIGSNAKVSTLHHLERIAKHDIFIVSDSDVRVETDYLRAIVPFFDGPEVGLVTCPYQGATTTPLPSLLESLLINTVFAPLVLVASQVEKTTYAFGATMAVTRHCVEQIGGFAALADYLADDYYLGQLVTQAGYEARIIPYVVETQPGVTTFRELFHHQVRWVRTQRTCRAGGYFGTVVTYGTVWALVGLATFWSSPLIHVLAWTALSLRLLSASLIHTFFLRPALPLRLLWLVPFTDLLSFLVWGVGMGGDTVRWSEYSFRVLADGKMVRVG